MHKLLNVYIKEKLDDSSYIDCNTSPFQILKKAEAEKKVYSIKSNMYVCAYRTMIKTSKGEEKKGVVLTFTIKLPNSSVTSSTVTDTIMGLIKSLDGTLYPIHNYHFTKSVEGMNKNIGILQVFKIDDEDYVFTI